MENEQVYVVLEIGAYETTILGVFRKKEDATVCFNDSIESGNEAVIEVKDLINQEDLCAVKF